MPREKTARPATRDLDLNLLKVFCCVADMGSLSRAAVALKASKATISRKIAQLEADLGESLLFRSTTNLTLTDMGRQLHREAGPLVLQLSHSIQQLTGRDRAALEATVRITAPEDFGASVLVPILAELHRTWPKIRVECLFTERVLDLVRESIDIAVRMGPPRGSELVARSLGTIAFDFVASAGYLATLAAPLTAETLGEHVSVAFGMAGSHAPLAFPGRQADFAFPARIWSKSFASIYNLVVGGYGATFLPRFLVKDDCAAGRLVRILPECAPEPIPAYLVTLEKRRTSPAASEVLRFLSARLPASLG